MHQLISSKSFTISYTLFCNSIGITLPALFNFEASGFAFINTPLAKDFAKKFDIPFTSLFKPAN